MATYQELKVKALNLTDQSLEIDADASAIAEYGLEEGLKYVANQINLPGLIGQASATWGASTESIPLGLGGFEITDYQAPNRLYIKRDSDVEGVGIPYEYLEYLFWLDAKSIPLGDTRDSLFEENTLDERPARSYTIDFDSNLIAHPVAEDNVLTFFYKKEPAAYSAIGVPEIPSNFNYILVDAAILCLKEWLREPEAIVAPQTLFKALDPAIAVIQEELWGKRKRRNLKIHRSYSVRY